MSEVSWNRVYLLGYYGPDGTAYLTSWGGDRPLRQFVVSGAPVGRVPLWTARVPEGAKVYDDDGAAPDGLRAIGWLVDEDIKRGEK